MHHNYSSHGGGNMIRVRSPSVETMDLSTHNTTEANRSASSVIQELKRSNAKLAERLTENETKYLSQLSTLQSQLESAKQRLAETTLSLETNRQTSAYQRHEMSVLKQRVIELEQEQEELKNNKIDDNNDGCDDKHNNDDGSSVASQQQSAVFKNLQAINQLQQATIEEMEWKLKTLQQEKDSQDQYRTDEVEDLRVLLDAQEQQIGKLQNELERTNEELEYMKSLHAQRLRRETQGEEPLEEKKEDPAVDIGKTEEEKRTATKPQGEEDCLNTTQITVDTLEDEGGEEGEADDYSGGGEREEANDEGGSDNEAEKEADEEPAPFITDIISKEAQPTTENNETNDHGDDLCRQEAGLLAAKKISSVTTPTSDESAITNESKEYDRGEYLYQQAAAALLAQPVPSAPSSTTEELPSISESNNNDDGRSDNLRQIEAMRLAEQLQEQIREGQRVMERLQQRQEDLMLREREVEEKQKLSNSLSFKYIVDTPGKLGLVLQSNVVHGIKSSSPLLGLVQVGDKVIEIDGRNTRDGTLSEVVRLLSQPDRERIVFERTGQIYN